MTYLIWFLFCGGYLVSAWAAKKRDSAEAALCFFDGIYLAMLCFAILPLAMGNAFFYGAAALSAVGVALGLLAEKRISMEKALQTAILIGLTTALFFLAGKELTCMEAVFLALFGGMGLYHASAGVLPEPIRIGRALLSAGGFLLGTIYFSPIL
ncbi:hypothetical protein [Anaerotignum sp.]